MTTASTDDSSPPEKRGAVVAHFGIEVGVEFTGETKMRRVAAPRKLGLCVGDRVILKTKGLALEERRNLLRRHRELRPPQLVASNVDALLILVTSDPPPRFGFIERAVAAAREQNIMPIIAVNKTDLDDAARFAEELQSRYDGSIEVFSLSVLTGDNFPQLMARLKSVGTTVVIGPSGVGKSSLTNRVVGDGSARVGSLSDATGRGKHTTTMARRYLLDGGGAIIDTPGMRDFGLATVSREAFAEVFPGFEHVDGACRFRNCLHAGEPGCAVDAAVAAGQLARERLDAYRQLLAGLA